MTNMDKLYEAVEARGPVCVGLDTDFSYLPADFVDSTLTRGENIVRFNQKLIDATKAVAGCYKVQIAYYESLGLEGMKAYADTLKAVREAATEMARLRNEMADLHDALGDKLAAEVGVPEGFKDAPRGPRGPRGDRGPAMDCPRGDGPRGDAGYYDGPHRGHY